MTELLVLCFNIQYEKLNLFYHLFYPKNIECLFVQVDSIYDIWYVNSRFYNYLHIYIFFVINKRKKTKCMRFNLLSSVHLHNLSIYNVKVKLVRHHCPVPHRPYQHRSHHDSWHPPLHGWLSLCRLHVLYILDTCEPTMNSILSYNSTLLCITV